MSKPQLVQAGRCRWEVHDVITTGQYHQFSFLGYLIEEAGMWFFERAVWEDTGHRTERNPRPFALRDGALAALLRPVVMS